MKKQVLIIALCIGNLSVLANVTLPGIFSDNMVLQRNTPIPVWGWADANERIEVKFNAQTKIIKADFLQSFKKLSSKKAMVRNMMRLINNNYSMLLCCLCNVINGRIKIKIA